MTAYLIADARNGRKVAGPRLGTSPAASPSGRGCGRCDRAGRRPHNFDALQNGPSATQNGPTLILVINIGGSAEELDGPRRHARRTGLASASPSLPPVRSPSRRDHCGTRAPRRRQAHLPREPGQDTGDDPPAIRGRPMTRVATLPLAERSRPR